MPSIYDVSGGIGALGWLDRATRLQSAAGIGPTFPAADLSRGAGTASASAGGAAPPLSQADSARLAEVSASAGVAILGYLTSLRDAAAQAQSPQYSAAVGAQAATASSRVNLQVAANGLLAAIDRMAAGAQVNGLGLLDGSRSGVTLSTTALGGRLAATSQPLTTSALGISAVDLTSDGGVADAAARLQGAIDTARQRLQNLQALDQLYRNQSSYLSGVATALAQSEGGRLSQLSGVGNTGYGQAAAAYGQSRGLALNIQA